MPDEISSIVGQICAQIHEWASDDTWSKLFKPSVSNSKISREAVDLRFQNKHDLVFLMIFKGIEAEAKRLLKAEHHKEKPDKVIAALHESGVISEHEFHFLNGLRALRNTVAHGYPDESETIDKLFLSNELRAGVLLAILMLMRLQSERDKDTCVIRRSA
jgi:hypothetical protein